MQVQTNAKQRKQTNNCCCLGVFCVPPSRSPPQWLETCHATSRCIECRFKQTRSNANKQTTAAAWGFFAYRPLDRRLDGWKHVTPLRDALNAGSNKREATQTNKQLLLLGGFLRTALSIAASMAGNM